MENWFKELIESVVYPRKDSRWLTKSWPLLVIALIPIISLVAPIFFKGWRLSAIRARMHAEDQLPELDLRAFFVQGLILWGFTFAYMLVPLTINTLIYLTTESWPNVFVSFSIFVVWFFASLPVYQAGLVRCAVNGRWRSMWNVPANFTYFIKHVPQFINFYISWIVIVFLIGVFSYFLAFTVLGIPLLPVFILTAYYVSTAHELSGLARKIVAKNNDTLEFNKSDALDTQQ